MSSGQIELKLRNRVVECVLQAGKKDVCCRSKLISGESISIERCRRYCVAPEDIYLGS